MDRASQVRASCEPLSQTLPGDLQPRAGSCGLDFWQSPAALAWTGRFLGATPALLTVEAGSRRAALVCLLRRLPLGFTLASAYPYAVVAGDPGIFWESGEAVAAALARQRVVRLEMPFAGEYAGQPPPLEGSRPYRHASHLDAVRHVLDLGEATGNPGWLAPKLAPNTRWAIRKAERIGGRVRRAMPPDLGDIFSIYAAAMRIKGAPVNYGPERFRGMLEDLPSEAACIYIGEVQGRVVGMAAVLDGAVSRHLLQIAVLPEAQSTRMSELLINAAIGDAIRRGTRWFDFMASSPSDTGLMAFKAKWATQAQSISYVALTVNPFMDFAIDLGRWWNIQCGRLASRERHPSRDEDGA